MHTLNPFRLTTRRSWMLLLVTLFALSACGQKGPLKVERPPVAQEEELEETK